MNALATKSPRVVGRYLVFEPFASGGMATVHLGRLFGPEGFSRTVAIKQLHPQFARDPEFVAMLMDEARLAARVHHPNVVSPLDVVVLDSEVFVVMEFVHGESLSQLMALTRGIPVPPEIASSIMVQVLLGLHAAHEASDERGLPLNIVHRDVSPQNILVGPDGLARVVDFGIAKAARRLNTTGDNQLKGKLSYMAPEQLRLQPPDRRTDVFTAGIVLWEMLTGHQLFSVESPAAAVERILNHVPEVPSELTPGLPAALDAVTMRALSSDPLERYQSARSMALALQSAVAPQGSLVVGAWVETVCGDLLKSRAQRVSEIESVTLADFPDFGRNATTSFALARPSATDLSSVQPNIEIGTAPARNRKARRERVPILLGSLLIVGAGIGSVLAFGLPGRDKESAAAEGPAVIELPVDPAEVTPVEHPAATAPRVTAAPAKAHEEPQVPVATPEPSGKPPKPPPKPRVPAKTGTEQPTAKPKTNPDCDPPYFIDPQGVKRFKLRCF